MPLRSSSIRLSTLVRDVSGQLVQQLAPSSSGALPASTSGGGGGGAAAAAAAAGRALPLALAPQGQPQAGAVGAHLAGPGWLPPGRFGAVLMDGFEPPQVRAAS